MPCPLSGTVLQPTMLAETTVTTLTTNLSTFVLMSVVSFFYKIKRNRTDFMYHALERQTKTARRIDFISILSLHVLKVLLQHFVMDYHSIIRLVE